MAELKDMPEKLLRELIQSQLDAKQKAERVVVELTELLTESIGDFYRRCVEGDKNAGR